jgi:putative membrane protein
MILKRNFNLGRVIYNIRFETITTLTIAVSVWALYALDILRVSLPFSIAAILGSGLAIFVAFRNQSSYGRWWEARTIWGGIVNNSRIFARQIIANADNGLAIGKAPAESIASFKQEMVYRQIAFAHALRLHLRRQENWEELSHLLSQQEYKQLLSHQNKPNMLLHAQGMRIKEGMRMEILGAFDNISMEPNLATFNNGQGACERIKNTPLPMNYQYFTKLFLYVFIFILPLCLAGDFFKMEMGWMMIPVSFIISFVFAVMNRVGEINENPFENKMQDIPMTALCNTIERDLKEILGEKELPFIFKAEHGYLM